MHKDDSPRETFESPSQQIAERLRSDEESSDYWVKLLGHPNKHERPKTVYAQIRYRLLNTLEVAHAVRETAAVLNEPPGVLDSLWRWGRRWLGVCDRQKSDTLLLAVPMLTREMSLALVVRLFVARQVLTQRIDEQFTALHSPPIDLPRGLSAPNYCRAGYHYCRQTLIDICSVLRPEIAVRASGLFKLGLKVSRMGSFERELDSLQKLVKDLFAIPLGRTWSRAAERTRRRMPDMDVVGWLSPRIESESIQAEERYHKPQSEVGEVEPTLADVLLLLLASLREQCPLAARDAAEQSPAAGDVPLPDEGGGPKTEEKDTATLKPADRKAYLAYRWAESKLGKPTDREAYEWLKENGLPDEADGLEVANQLADYRLPSCETWSRQLRSARKVLKAQKYSKRAGRPFGRSIVSERDIQLPADD